MLKPMLEHCRRSPRPSCRSGPSTRCPRLLRRPGRSGTSRTRSSSDSSSVGASLPLWSERSKAALPLITASDPSRTSLKIESNGVDRVREDVGAADHRDPEHDRDRGQGQPSFRPSRPLSAKRVIRRQRSSRPSPRANSGVRASTSSSGAGKPAAQGGLARRLRGAVTRGCGIAASKQPTSSCWRRQRR